MDNKQDKPKGRGWYGNAEGHRQAGRKGGKAPHRLRGLQAADEATRKRVARTGGYVSIRKPKPKPTSEADDLPL